MVDDFGERGLATVGDLLATWALEDSQRSRYQIDGMEGGMTTIGTMEREVGAATRRDGTLLIATKEYVEAHTRGNNAVYDE